MKEAEQLSTVRMEASAGGGRLHATPYHVMRFSTILQHAVKHDTPSLWLHPASHHSLPAPLGDIKFLSLSLSLSLSLLSESSHLMENVHSSLTDEHACHLPRFPFHGLSSQMVAERDSPWRALWRMGYSIIHDSTMEREATGGVVAETWQEFCVLNVCLQSTVPCLIVEYDCLFCALSLSRTVERVQCPGSFWFQCLLWCGDWR